MLEEIWDAVTSGRRHARTARTTAACHHRRDRPGASASSISPIRRAAPSAIFTGSAVRAPLPRHAHRDGAGPGAYVEFRIRRPGVVRHRAEPEAICHSRETTRYVAMLSVALRGIAALAPAAYQIWTMTNKHRTAKILRKEDATLLSGRGRYADDLPVPVGTLHAHVVRSPHAHADIVRIDAAAALAHDGVWAVITGEDVRKLSDPFLAAVKVAGAAMGAGGRAGALCRRAGRARGGGKPLYRRGRRRTGRDRI